MEPNRILSLDGLRALSIGCVLFAHLAGTQGFLTQASVAWLGDLGILGVRFFFVISGYLISTLLFEEERRKGQISIRSFYMRRTLRIFPAAYVFVLLITLASNWNWGAVTPSDLSHAVTYTMNFHGARSWVVGHLWSLSTEEQFYLLWPAVVLWGGLLGAARTAAAVVVLAPALRLVLWSAFPEWRSSLSAASMGADSIATGCLLAALRPKLEAHAVYQRILSSRWLPAIGLLIVAVNALEGGSRFAFGAGFTVLNVSTALLIHHVIRFPEYTLGRILNHTIFACIGVLSYSLYLWQQIFLNRTGEMWINRFPQNIACAFLAACISYYLVERPFLAIRRRLEIKTKPPIPAPRPIRAHA
ncbi:MAG TPA: acyltransferase [Bryobacteraceae bacterium]